MDTVSDLQKENQLLRQRVEELESLLNQLQSGKGLIAEQQQQLSGIEDSSSAAQAQETATTQPAEVPQDQALSDIGQSRLVEEAQEVNKVTKRGEWSVAKRSAGGCFNTSQWRQNPQYFLTLRGPTTYIPFPENLRSTN